MKSKKKEKKKWQPLCHTLNGGNAKFDESSLHPQVWQEKGQQPLPRSQRLQPCPQHHGGSAKFDESSFQPQAWQVCQRGERGSC